MNFENSNFISADIHNNFQSMLLSLKAKLILSVHELNKSSVKWVFEKGNIKKRNEKEKMRNQRILKLEFLLISLIGSLSCYSIDGEKLPENGIYCSLALQDSEVNRSFYHLLNNVIVPDCSQPDNLFQKGIDLRVRRELIQAREIFEKIVDSVGVYLKLVDRPYGDFSMKVPALIDRQRMEVYRKGNNVIPTKKELVRKYFEDILAQVYNELAIAAWWGDLYEDAKYFYQSSARFAHPRAFSGIAELYAKNKIALTKEERFRFLEVQFFILCDENGWNFPVKKEGFQFSHRALEMIIPSGSIGEPMSGFYVKTLKIENRAKLVCPVIWVQEPHGLDNQGDIDTQLLIVGTEKITLLEAKRNKNKRKKVNMEKRNYAVADAARPNR